MLALFIHQEGINRLHSQQHHEQLKSNLTLVDPMGMTPLLVVRIISVTVVNIISVLMVTIISI